MCCDRARYHIDDKGAGDGDSWEYSRVQSSRQLATVCRTTEIPSASNGVESEKKRATFLTVIGSATFKMLGSDTVEAHSCVANSEIH